MMSLSLETNLSMTQSRKPRSHFSRLGARRIKKHCNILQSRETMHLSLDDSTCNSAMRRRHFSPMKINYFHLRYLIWARFILARSPSFLSHLDSSGMPNPSEFCQCKILDGATVVHFLSTDSVKTFSEYADKVFIPFLQNNCSKLAGLTACGIGIYSIKEATREHRGHGTHTKVSQQTKMPKKWSDFLRVAKNKQELISLLTTKVAEMTVPEEKRIYITSGKFSVL